MRKKILNSVAGLIFAFGVFFQSTGLGNIPRTLNLSYGERKYINIGNAVSLTPNSETVLRLTSETGKDKGVELIPQNTGETNIDVDVFGVKVKSVKVNVNGRKNVVVGGQSIGVALYTKGALVVGASNLRDEKGNTVNPAKDAGIEAGDIIEKVNETEVKDADHVMTLINAVTVSGAPVNLQILRNGKKLTITVNPVKDKTDGTYRMGIWVRDSMAGVGTMSFYDPETMKFASLGHAVYDSDTNTLLKVKSGEIVQSEIFGIKQGKEGSPGELQGSFDDAKPKIGQIITNNDFGIYGKLYFEPVKNDYNRLVETATIDETTVGPAKILTTIDNSGVKEYDVYIEKLSSQEYPGTKSMVIKVTDKRLLETTGGIIQGMSGSPIIQNGKLVGAVTHVFVNDPTKGYGLYAQWMLEQME